MNNNNSAKNFSYRLEKLIGAKEVAAELSTKNDRPTPERIIALGKAGKIPAYIPGDKNLKFLMSEVEVWLFDEKSQADHWLSPKTDFPTPLNNFKKVLKSRYEEMIKNLNTLSKTVEEKQSRLIETEQEKNKTQQESYKETIDTNFVMPFVTNSKFIEVGGININLDKVVFFGMVENVFDGHSETIAPFLAIATDTIVYKIKPFKTPIKTAEPIQTTEEEPLQEKQARGKYIGPIKLFFPNYDSLCAKYNFKTNDKNKKPLSEAVDKVYKYLIQNANNGKEYKHKSVKNAMESHYKELKLKHEVMLEARS